jgi:RimJ/RimL family protein N-acetyltransferase
MISIQTSRLQLIPLDHEMLQIWSQAGRESLEKSLQLVPNSWELEKFYQDETLLALRDFWLPMTKKFPLEFTWYTNWEIILKEKTCSIGGIGLSGMPNNDGSTEIGYVIDQKFRGSGFATEAVDALKNWAFKDHDLKIIKAETPILNLHSQKVLQKNNFKIVGEKQINIPEPTPLYCWECVRPLIRVNEI